MVLSGMSYSDAKSRALADAKAIRSKMEAVWVINSTWQTFSFDAMCCAVDNETGRAMAEAIKHNTTLQSFSFNARCTRHGQ